MNIYISDNIKRLRKQKGITQETLAERMHVSTAAVSKWERNEALPDISMVLPLASYFEVSTDELLGLNAAKTEERIQEIINERNHLCALGKVYEAFNLIVAAYDDLPQTATYMSFLVRGNVFDARNINSGTEENDVARELRYLLESDSYSELKDTSQMKAIIAKYETFAGKKRVNQ